MSRKRRKSIAPGEWSEGALPLLDTPFADEPEPVADDEIVGVERTGAHEPLSMESTGASVALDVDESDELPAVLSSVAGEVLDPPSLPGLPETDRTAAYDPPPDLFADIPDPEANPVAVAFHEQSTNFIPVARIERGDEVPVAAPARTAQAPAPAPAPAREEREFSLFEPESEPEDAAATRARPAAAPAPTPVAAPGKAAARPKKPAEKPHRPPGPMHRPVAREPAPAPAPKADPAENELTGIYEPPEVVPELPRGKLTIVEGENTGKSYFLNRNRSMVGRGIDNDIVLMDIAVSRKHFRVDRHAEGFKVVDLASGNGTTLNGKRVAEAELYDGDRIDLGNTTIEFLSVGRTRARLPAGTPGTVEAPITDHGRGQTPISPVRGAAGGPRIPWTWVGLWAAATFLAVLVVLVLVRRHRADAPGDASGAAARAHVELAESAMRARAWKRAEEELTVARQLGPELVAQVPFDDHAARIARERDAQRRLDDARRKVGIDPPAAVQALLLGIGRDSVYYSEARNLIAELDTLAEASRAAGNVPGSAAPGPSTLATQAPPTAAPEIRPEPARVESVKVAAGRPDSGGAANAGAGAETEKRAKADIAEALRLYRDEKFDDAAAALEKAARRAPGTKTSKDAQGKAKAVREFAEQWATAQKALRSRRAREASDALSRAAATDRRLGGHHREKIDGQLAEQLYMVAIQAYNRQAYDEAVQANGRVLEISPGHGLATRLQDKMRRSAMLIARQAQQALDSGDRDAAKRLAQAALKLVNESDGAGKAARKVLDKL